jgi:hypothetical protein
LSLLILQQRKVSSVGGSSSGITNCTVIIPFASE